MGESTESQNPASDAEGDDTEAPLTTESQAHIVGPPLTMDSRSRGRVLRQRCLWCGTLVMEVELDRVAVQLPPDGSQPRPIGTWEPGAVVRIEGINPRISALVEVGPDEMLPADACANLDYGVTA